MRTLAVLFVTAAALAAPAASVASATEPQWCQAEVCTDPVGHFTKPVQPIIGDLLEPRP